MAAEEPPVENDPDEWWPETKRERRARHHEVVTVQPPDEDIHHALSKKARKRRNKERRAHEHEHHADAIMAAIERSVPSLVALCIHALMRIKHADLSLVPVDLLDRVADEIVMKHIQESELESIVDMFGQDSFGVEAYPADYARSEDIPTIFQWACERNEALLARYIYAAGDGNPDGADPEEYNAATEPCIAKYRIETRRQYQVMPLVQPEVPLGNWGTYTRTVLRADSPLWMRARALVFARMGNLTGAHSILSKLIDGHTSQYFECVAHEAEQNRWALDHERNRAVTGMDLEGREIPPQAPLEARLRRVQLQREWGREHIERNEALLQGLLETYNAVMLALVHHSFGHHEAAGALVQAVVAHLPPAFAMSAMNVAGALRDAAGAAAKAPIGEWWADTLALKTNNNFRRVCEHFLARDRLDELIGYLSRQRSLAEQWAEGAHEGTASVHAPPDANITVGRHGDGPINWQLYNQTWYGLEMIHHYPRAWPADPGANPRSDIHPVYHLACAYARSGDMGRALHEWGRLGYDAALVSPLTRLDLLRPAGTPIKCIPVKWRFFASCPNERLVADGVTYTKYWRRDALTTHRDQLLATTYDRGLLAAPVTCINKRTGTFISDTSTSVAVARKPWKMAREAAYFRPFNHRFPVHAVSTFTVEVLDVGGTRVVLDNDGGFNGAVAYRQERGSVQWCDLVREVVRAQQAEVRQTFVDNPAMEITPEEFDIIEREAWARELLLTTRKAYMDAVGRLRARVARQEAKRQEKAGKGKAKEEEVKAEKKGKKGSEGSDEPPKFDKALGRALTPEERQAWTARREAERNDLFPGDRYTGDTPLVLRRLYIERIVRVGIHHVLVHLVNDDSALSMRTEYFDAPAYPTALNALVVLSCNGAPEQFRSPKVYLAGTGNVWTLPGGAAERNVSLGARYSNTRHVVAARHRLAIDAESSAEALIFDANSMDRVIVHTYNVNGLSPKFAMNDCIYGFAPPFDHAEGDPLERAIVAKAPLAAPGEITARAEAPISQAFDAPSFSESLMRCGPRHVLATSTREPCLEVRILDASDLHTVTTWDLLPENAFTHIATEDAAGRVLLAMGRQAVVFDGEQGAIVKTLEMPCAVGCAVFTPHGLVIATECTDLFTSNALYPPHTAIYWFDAAYTLKGSHEYVAGGLNGLCYDAETPCVYALDRGGDLVCLDLAPAAIQN